MNRHGGRRWAQAAACAAALVTPLVVSGCQNAAGTIATTGGQGATNASGTITPTAAQTARSTPNAPTRASLTVSDGGSKILMNGRTVDFGTDVHDHSWSADGKQVLFIDGNGNLTVANADGTGRTVIAENPGDQKWSHPTWEAVADDTWEGGLPARANLFFASIANDAATLWEIAPDAHDGQPHPLELSTQPDAPIPQTGDKWPSASGQDGAAVFENDHDSTSDLWIRDQNTRVQSGLWIKSAAEPDLVAYGGSSCAAVVFVRSVGGHKHVFLNSLQPNAAARDLTPKATADCTEPALSPDGKTVAFSTPSGVETEPVDGGGPPTQVTSTPGFPAFRPGS